MSVWGEAKKTVKKGTHTAGGHNPYVRYQRNKREQQKTSDDNAAYQKDLQSQIDEMMSNRPQYQSMTYDGGKLKGNFKANVSNYDSNLGELDKRLGGIGDVNAGENFSDAQGNVVYLQDQAMSDAPTEWANRQLEFQDVQDQMAREDIAKNNDRARENAYSQLAMRGGLDSGARERLAESFGNNSMEQTQMQSRNNQLANLGVLSQDESNKMGLARDLPGMNLQLDSYDTGLQDSNRQADFAKVNTWGSMADSESARKFDAANKMELYNKQTAANAFDKQRDHTQSAWGDQMKSFAAGKSGDAMAKTGEKKASNNPGNKIFGAFG